MACEPREWDARAYDAGPQPQERWGTRILNLLDLRGDEVVLEAGCGTGRDVARLLDRLPRGRVIGVDGSEQMLEQTRRNLAGRLDRVETVQADLQQPLPIEDPVDVVFSVACFHWIHDHSSLFANLFRVLRPGGRLGADCGGVGNIAQVYDAIDAIPGSPPARGPWNFANVEDTRRRLAEAGFVDIDVWLLSDPVPLEPGPQLEGFLTTVVLGWHLEQLPLPERGPFVKAVAERIPGGVIDYVRLTIDARKP